MRQEPVLLSNDSRFSQQFECCQSNIFNILNHHGIRTRLHVVDCLQWRFPNESEKRRTVTIHTTEDINHKQWLDAATKIHELFATSELDVQVEVYNPQGLHFKEITNEPPCENNQEDYSSCESHLYHVLDQYLPRSWRDIGLFVCKDTAQKKNIVSVVVFVEENSTHDWIAAAAEITRVLDGRFQWRFQPGCHRFFSLKLRSEAGFREDGQFPPDVRSGSTISYDDSKSSGTIGVFVDLIVSGGSGAVCGMSPGTHKAVISCHHCTAPLPISGSPLDPESVFTQGYPESIDSVDGPYMFSPSIYSPARYDLVTSIECLDAKIKEEKQYLNNIHCQHRTSTDRISASQDEIMELQKRLAQCKGRQCCEASIGKVIASSGLYVQDLGCELMERSHTFLQDGIKADTFVDYCPMQHKHYLHDFAIISLNNESHAVNEAPPGNLGGKKSILIDSTALPIKNSVVYKHGGRTDVTQGIVKDYTLVNSEITFEKSSIVDNESVNTKELRFRAWRVVSEDQSRPFADSGDSGSGVNNENKQLVGQIHSCFCDGRSVPVTYMNAIDEVFRDAEMKMPGVRIKLSLPEKSLLGKIIERLQTGVGRIPWARQVLTASEQMSYASEPLMGDAYV